MNLVEALARAGSTLPTASGEVVIVHARRGRRRADAADADRRTRHRAREPARAAERRLRRRTRALRDGDTIFVPRAPSVYVFGQVKNPGAYTCSSRARPCCRRCRSPAASPTAAATTRIKIIRIVDGEKKELKAKLTDIVQPGDTIVVPERFF